MRLFLSLFALVLATASFGQSKKELLASKAELTQQVASLKSEIEQMKKIKEVILDSEQKKASYGIGVLIGTNLVTQGGDSLDLSTMISGLSDIYGNKALKMDKQECSTVVQTYMQGAMGRKAEKLREGGVAFLKENKTKEGVITTASGLQYKVITSGNGKTPKATDNVTVHYTGQTIDGNVFDSSVKRGQPATFGVSGVIAGWTEALQLMHEGDKWTLYIPSELAYGERGQGGQIAPYAVLIFDVELIKVN